MAGFFVSLARRLSPSGNENPSKTHSFLGTKSLLFPRSGQGFSFFPRPVFGRGGRFFCKTRVGKLYCICSFGRDRVFNFSKTSSLQRGQGFLQNSCWKTFPARVLTFPVAVLCQTNTIRNIRHLEKVGFGSFFCFPWEAFVTLGLRPRDAKLSLGQRKPFQNPLFSWYEITMFPRSGQGFPFFQDQL